MLSNSPQNNTTNTTTAAMNRIENTQSSQTPQSVCPKCHQATDLNDYFCRNCGQELHKPPPATSISAQLSLYLKSALLPPMGIIWGFSYLRQKSTASKIIGIVAIVITIFVLTYATMLTIKTINLVNLQVEQQLQQMVF